MRRRKCWFCSGQLSPPQAGGKQLWHDKHLLKAKQLQACAVNAQITGVRENWRLLGRQRTFSCCSKHHRKPVHQKLDPNMTLRRRELHPSCKETQQLQGTVTSTYLWVSHSKDSALTWPQGTTNTHSAKTQSGKFIVKAGFHFPFRPSVLAATKLGVGWGGAVQRLTISFCLWFRVMDALFVHTEQTETCGAETESLLSHHITSCRTAHHVSELGRFPSPETSHLTSQYLSNLSVFDFSLFQLRVSELKLVTFSFYQQWLRRHYIHFFNLWGQVFTSCPGTETVSFVIKRLFSGKPGNKLKV